MDHFALGIQRKMSKIENSLLDLNGEIFTAIQYLLRLKENSNKIVSNLNSVVTQANYLKEFMDVNSFILKYLSFLTEINCKFEMLEMSEKSFANNTSISKSIEVMPGDLNKLNLSISSESILDLKPNDSSADSKKIIVEQPSESDASFYIKLVNEKKSKKKKSKTANSKNCQKAQNDNKSKKKFDSSDKSTKKIMQNIKNYSFTKLKSTELFNKSTSITDKDEFTSHSDSVDEKEVNCLNKINSGTCVISKSNLIDINLEEIKQSLPVGVKDSPSFDSVCNSPLDEIIPTEIQSYVGDLGPREAERPMKNNEKRFCSEISENYSITQSPEYLKQKVTLCNNPLEKKIESENESEVCGIKKASIIRKPGEEYVVSVEHIKSPSEFYVSFADHQSEFLELEKRLKLLPEKKFKINNKRSENRKALLNKEIGSYALFYSKCDEIWCRAKVTNWYLNFLDDFVNIFLIDYGESKCVSVDDLIPMAECFKQYPAFTQRCHLYGVFPSDMDMDNNCETLSWEKESTEKMKSLTENSKKIKIKVACDDGFHPFASLPVTLWLVDQNNECVNELLVKNKYAVQGSNYDRPINTEIIGNHVTENESLHSWNPMKEDFESYQNLYDLDVNDPAALIYGYVGKDYERICLHFAKTGYCFKGQACRKEHKKLDPLGFTTDQEEIYKNAFNVLQVPPPKSVLNVQVTCLLSVNKFYCIPEDRCASYSDENLQSLLKFMNSSENVRDMKKLLVPPSTGQIVIAKYSEDDSWYRARILESEPEKDAYKVLYVDYGNKEILPFTEIRAIEAKYLHLPFQAMHCSIFGIDLNPELPLKEVMDFLNHKMYDEHISIEIVAQLPGEDVNLLVNVFDQNGKNIAEDLIAKHYASFKKEMVISDHSLSIPG